MTASTAVVRVTNLTPGCDCNPGFMVYGLWFMVYGLWFMVYGPSAPAPDSYEVAKLLATLPMQLARRGALYTLHPVDP
jgi:hypothetical protein